MRHRVHKIKVKLGKDANKMLIRKLIINFLSRQRIITTLKKAKIIKPKIERLVEKSKLKSEANKNYLLRFISDKKLIDFLFNVVGEVLKDVKGGYIRIVKIGKRDSDGAEIVKLEWVYPIVKK